MAAKDLTRLPAGRVGREAIELAIEGRSPYPDRALFIDADEAWTASQITRAVNEGMAAVLVYEDGTTSSLRAERAHRWDTSNSSSDGTDRRPVSAARAASPASIAMDEAIESAIAGTLTFPSRATFIDADGPALGTAIKRAVAEGDPVVLAYSDGTTCVLRPEVAS